MKQWIGFEHGMGIGGWLTNYKRFNCLREDRRLDLTVGDFEHFRTYITERDVAYIQSLGMDHIRLGFDQIVLEEPDGTVRPEILGLMQSFVSWCRKYDLRVVLNLHKAVGNYCDIKESVSLMEDPVLQSRFVRLWERMEDAFADDNEVAFELLNEVRDIDPALWNDLAARTVAAIRRKNADRVIVLGSTCWNAVDTLSDLAVLDDDKVVYTFHMYEPYSFTHQRGVLTDGPLYYNRDMPYPGDIEHYRDYEQVVCGRDDTYADYEIMDRRYVWDRMQGALDFMAKHPDKILWCGEFGTIRHAKTAWREQWMCDVIAFLKKNGIPYCCWNYLSTPNDGNRFSLVDDDSREILTESLARILRGEVE